jgi:signal transduction histidine kinase
MTARDAAERIGELLRSGSPDAVELNDIGTQLVVAARYPKWEVRKAVAGAIQYLRHDSFHLVVASLLKDDNAYVRSAAERSLSRRTELTRVDILKEQHGDLLLGWLSDLEARHGRRAREEALRVAEKYAGLLVREAHHEIVKVLAPLDLTLMNLQDRLNGLGMDKEVSDSIARGRTRLKLLSSIIVSLRDLTTDVTPDFHSYGLRDIVEECVALLEDRSPISNRRTTIDLDIDPALRLDAHRHRLFQAFSNLLENAFEACSTKASGSIRVDARVDSEHVRIAFADTGCGMSEEALRDSVQLYSSSKQGGTGFGLPLTKKKQVGTTVTVTLPLEQPHQDQ